MLAVFRVSQQGLHVSRSILCNSTNNPFGGAGSSGDIGAGNGMRTAGKGLSLMSPLYAQCHHMYHGC